MTRLVAVFETPEALISSAGKLRSEGFPAEDAVTPFHVQGLENALETRTPRIRPLMAIAGLSVAAVAYGMEWFSAAVAYPINSGGRPFNSWQVFLLVPFEAGILAAGLAGFIAFLICCGLPSLHHPLFAVPGIERASADRFFLIVNATADYSIQTRLRNILTGEGALSIEEIPR